MTSRHGPVDLHLPGDDTMYLSNFYYLSTVPQDRLIRDHQLYNRMRVSSNSSTNCTTEPIVATGWIGVHGYFMPPQTPEQLNPRLSGPRTFRVNPESTISYLDKAGIVIQMLSNIPLTLPVLKASKDYGASLVSTYPSRYGLLAALPTDKPGCFSGRNRPRDKRLARRPFCSHSCL